jgi:hypothetical protein
LGNNWTISVNLILESSIKMFLLDGIRHNDQKEIKILALFWQFHLSTILIFAANISAVVVIDGILESLDARLVAELYDVAIIDINIKSSLF